MALGADRSQALHTLCPVRGSLPLERRQRHRRCPARSTVTLPGSRQSSAAAQAGHKHKETP